MARRDAGNISQSANHRSVQLAMMKGRHTIPLCARCDNLMWANPSRIARALATKNFTAG